LPLVAAGKGQENGNTKKWLRCGLGAMVQSALRGDLRVLQQQQADET
jgi:hypothetical protein